MSLLLAAALATNSPATEVGVANSWARCLWSEMPQSAANWIEMPVEKPQGYQSTSQFQRLKFRLRSACWNRVIGERRDWAKFDFADLLVRDALIRTRPIRVQPDRANPGAFVCQSFEGEKLVAEHFGWSKHNRSRPYGGYRVECRDIANDGSLKPHA